MQSFLYSAFFVASEDGTHMDVLGVQQDMRQYPKIEYVTAAMNSFDFPSPLDAWTVTPNGQHIFLATARHQWELASQARLVEICQARETNETARQLFAQYEQLCSTPFGAPKPASYADFVFMLSMCSQNTYCPEFARFPPSGMDYGLNVTDAPLGFYTPAPGILRQCEPGNVCRSGKRTPCPRGFVCPNRGMTVPQPCHGTPGIFNVTCFEEGLSAYKPCPDGFVCLSVDYPPVPAPAGRYVLPGRPAGPGILCPANGSYCPLAATYPPPLCPAGFYCSDPAVLYPVPCPTAYDANFTQIANYTSYCPNGTAEARHCPAGYFCPVPWELRKCDLGDFCPEGSQKHQSCAAGRLCATPGDSVLCPAGYFCPEGSYEARKCSPLAMCAEGSSTQRGWLALSLEFVILALALVAYFTVRYIRSRRQKASLAASLALKREKNRFLPRQQLDEIDMEETDDTPLLGTSSSRPIELPGRPIIELEFKDIVLKVAGDKVVLDGVSGSFKPGQLSAIMGPSGAGKSSLVSVLCGDSTIASGDILINGVSDNPTRFKSVIGLVPQEDVMHNTLTVSEILRFNASVRLPRATTDAEREDLVQDILEVLKLKKIRHSIIGTESERGISGGERKRVNIGMELASDPSLLFLDEPVRSI
jgi:ABC-type lipopolysaccharide export system ATPase subunit